MTRKFFALILALLLFATLISCSKSDPTVPEGMKLASNDIVDYRLYVPKNWIVDMSTGVTSAYHSSIDTSNISLVVSSLNSANITPTEYWDSYKEQYTQTFPDLEELETANLLFGGKHAESHVFTATMMETKYKFQQVIAIHGTDAYIFTYTATEDKYDKHIEDVKKIIENFEFN